MRFFRNFPEFRNFPDLTGHSRGNPRSGLIFMGGGGGGYHILCMLADRQQCWNGTTYILTFNLFYLLSHHKFQDGVCTTSTSTSITWLQSDLLHCSCVQITANL